MVECVEGQCVVEVDDRSKLEAFDSTINACDRFEMVGLDESETKFVLRDTLKQDGIRDSYIKIDIQDVVYEPLEDVLDMIKNGSSDIVVKEEVGCGIGMYVH
jgi:hypothetical protein